MRAQVLPKHGGPENFELTDVATPHAGIGQVLVRVHAAAINPVDIKIREGLPIGPDLPAILGADLAGVVEAVGDGVTDFKVGDEVFGCAGGVRGLGGALAEYIAADQRLLAHRPKSISFRESAALPLVSITAWEAVEKVAPEKGELALVHGGVGGVGHIVVQLLRHAGVSVTTTVGKHSDLAIAKDIGADHQINYVDEGVSDYVSRITKGDGFAIVVDPVGAQNLVKSFEAAAIGGRIATTNARATVDLSLMHGKALSLHLVFMLLPMLKNVGRERHGIILRQIADLVDKGHLMPLVDPHAFKLGDLTEAHKLLASGNAQGKVVVEI